MKKTRRIVILMVLLISLVACSSSSSAASAPSASDNVSILPIVDDSDDDTVTIIGSDDDWVYDAGDEPYPIGDIPQGIDGDGSELSFEDFAFYDEVYYQGIPDGAYYPETQYAAGSWRYELYVYNQYDYGCSFAELGYADLTIEEYDGTAMLTLHPRLGNDGFESFPETDEEVGYEPFTGELDEYSGLVLYGNDLELYFSYYYAYEGREYVVASLWSSNDLIAGFLMVRGQD